MQKSQHSRNQCFSYYFCLKIEGSGPDPGGPKTYGSYGSVSAGEGWILRGPLSSSFWLPRNLSNHMDRQARTGDTMLLENREMTGRSQTLLRWLGVRKCKDDRKQNTVHWPRWTLNIQKIWLLKADPDLFFLSRDLGVQICAYNRGKLSILI